MLVTSLVRFSVFSVRFEIIGDTQGYSVMFIVTSILFKNTLMRVISNEVRGNSSQILALVNTLEKRNDVLI